MKYKLINNAAQKTYAIILAKDDEVSASLMEFARKENIHAAQFTAIGALSNAVVGYFDFSIRDYKRITIDGQTEVLSMIGDISIFDGKPKLHAHLVLGKSDGTAHGGHLLEAHVNPTLEIVVTESPSYLVRKMDQESGIPLISISNETTSASTL
jgi:predicted DNA-binding protein with PD1-like motif